MLAPGGIFRFVVPDLHARAQRYIDDYGRGAPDAAGVFMSSTLLGLEQRPRGLLQQIRAMVGASHHLWMWDDLSMAEELRHAGFINIRRCEFGDSADTMFAAVEERSRYVDKTTNIRECALEAQKPA